MKNSTEKEKKILIVAAHFPPCAASGVYRSLGFVRFLVKSDWHVSVLSLENIDEERIDLHLLEKIPGSTKVCRTGYFDIFALKKFFRSKKSVKHRSGESLSTDKKLLQTKKRSGMKETLSYLLKTPDSYNGWIIPGIVHVLLKVKRPDIVFATAPPFSALILAVLLKKIWRRPLVIDFRDPWVHNPFRPERPPLADRWDKILEHWVLNNADRVIMNTPEACRLYQELYGDLNDKFTFIFNGFDSRFPEIELTAAPVGNKVWLVHVGALYGSRSPEQLMKGVYGVEGIQIDMYGPGSEQYSENDAVTNVNFHPSVRHVDAVSLQKSADVTLVLGNCTAGSVQIPAKIFEALAISKVIWLIDTTDSPTRRMLQQNNIPHLFCENERNQIREIAMGLANMKENTMFPELSVTATDRFNRKKQAEKLKVLLETQLAKL